MQYLPIYDVHMMGGLRKSTCTCRRDVQSYRRSILELHGKAENHSGEIEFAEGCKEEKMVECGAHSSTDRYYSADIEGTYACSLRDIPEAKCDLVISKQPETECIELRKIKYEGISLSRTVRGPD